MLKQAIAVGIGSLALMAATAVCAEAARPRDADGDIANQAFQALQQKQPERTMELLAPLVARYDEQIAAQRAKGLAYCAKTMAEAVVDSAIAAKEKKDAVVYGPEVCDAYFYRAFALMELGKKAEALTALQALTELSPMHAQYFVELGYAYRVNGQDQKAKQSYEAAIGKAEFEADEAMQKKVRAAARRGFGYMLVEERDLDAAEKMYRLSLEDDPENAVAKSELQFISEHKPAQRQ